jgi:hypothetical protein
MSGLLGSLTSMSPPRRAGISSRRTDPTSAARLHRANALKRGRSITKAIAFGSVAALAAVGVYVSQSLPGHAASPGPSTSGTGTSTGASASATGATSGTPPAPDVSQGSGISAPASAPAPANQQAPVVSGSS